VCPSPANQQKIRFVKRLLSCNNSADKVKRRRQRFRQPGNPGCKSEELALSAEMGPALPDPDLADGRTTDPAGSALTAVDIDNEAAGLEDTIDIGSPGSNRLTQDRTDGGMQPVRLFRQEISRVRQWMESGAEETLIGVDVSDSGNK
jgi:hypothetical protein